jgi:hypothetical protein
MRKTGYLRSFRHIIFFMFLLWMVMTFRTTALAWPPFLTDDPEPVPFKHWEAYLFSTVDDTRKQTDVTGPAFEFNVGALPNLQTHLVIPIAYASSEGGPRNYGLGDIELGVKYVFIQEAEHQPMVGVFPMLEIPTGNDGRGLGNGRAWWRVPLWLQKSWGPWTTYGGAGYVINPTPGARNYCFGGWLIQRDFGEKLTFGGEIFAQGKSSDDTRSSVAFNLGGYFKNHAGLPTPLFWGHSLAGDRHTIGYLGLYWTGGFSKHIQKHAGSKSLRAPIEE